MKEKIKYLEADNDELKEKYAGIENELEDLKKYIIQEHINDFNKGLRQVVLFCKEVDVVDPRYDINKDVVDECLIDEEKMSLNHAVEELEDVGGDPIVEEETTIHEEANIVVK
ncbi:hypothetical protein DEO72_LG10g1496 [Vigna unguiculata]|uniref:Uncharacterized protein n=1 Tax=Vigna unguiculata TaxID=3917 RepID=A0A4D6NAF2_VIGUN|nr:hypothetical protein DEO72_LG10g1496 [Vigna unguiculata]